MPAGDLQLDRRDHLIAESVPLAAVQLKRHPDTTSFRESLLEDAFVSAIDQLEAGARAEITGRRKPRPPIPDWMGEMRDFDLKASLSGEARPSILIEAKVDDIKWTLYLLLSRPTNRPRTAAKQPGPWHKEGSTSCKF